MKVILFQKNIPVLCENHRYSLWKAVRVTGFLSLFYRNRHEGLKNALFQYALSGLLSQKNKGERILSLRPLDKWVISSSLLTCLPVLSLGIYR